MSDAPLTINSLYDFMLQIDKKITDLSITMDKKLTDLSTEIDKKLAPIKKDLQDVKNFQKYEADAIEYEVQVVLQKELEKSYNVANIEPFQMKNLRDIYDKPISELDAAFLVKTISMSSEDTFMFVLAEAKHYIHRGKVAQKLQQFERMVDMFRVAHTITPDTDISQYNPVFLTTLERNKFLTAITDWKLYFGALYWEKQLAETLQADIKKCRDLCFRFNNGQDKLTLYYKIKALESKWYTSTYNTQLTDDEILQLPKYDSILEKVDIIIPSGNRYTISNINQDLQPVYSVGGSKRKTHRNKPNDRI